MSKRILVCDDDESIMDIMRIVLEEKGFKVEIIKNATEIYQRITAFQPDLILVDLWMPNLNGQTITTHLKSNPQTKTVPIIVISANNDTAKIAREIGADGFLAKPFDINELERIVEKYMK